MAILSNKTLLGWLAPLAFCLVANEALATHIIGGEITYRYISDVSPTKKRYEFHLIVFRNCLAGSGPNGSNPSDIDKPANLAIYRGTWQTNSLFKSFTVDPKVSDVPPVIPACADVNNLPDACIQKGDYTFTQDLDVVAGQSYYIVYQRCCRTYAIANIQNPQSNGATFYAEITPEALAANNSSPEFKGFPPSFICSSFKLEYDHSAQDTVDHDSLAYFFCTPLMGGGNSGGAGNCTSPQPNPPCGPPFSNLLYLTPHTYDVPIPGAPAPMLDTLTGFLHGQPNKNGQYVVGVCVKEYRNGVYMGSIQRDFQFNVVDCVPGVIADVQEDSIMGVQDFLIRSCGSKTVYIVNQSKKNTSTLTYNWVFTIAGKDTSITTWDAFLTFPDWGIYSGILYLNTGFECADTGFIKVKVMPPIKADWSFTFDSCYHSPVIFTDKSVAENPGGIYSWKWDFGTPGGTSTVANPTFNYPNNGNYTATLTIADGNNCTSTKGYQIPYFPIPPAVIPPSGPWSVCWPDTVDFHVFDPANLTDVGIVWDFGDGKTSNDINPKHFYDHAGTFTAKVFTRNIYDCISADTFENAVMVFPKIEADFNFGYDSCSITPTVFQDNTLAEAIGGVSQWVWDFGTTQDSSRAKNPEFQFPSNGNFTVKLVTIDGNNCSSEVSKVVQYEPRPPVEIPNAGPWYLCDVDTLKLDLFDPNSLTTSTIIWDFGDGTAVSHDPNPVHYYTQYGVYSPSVFIENEYGCTNQDTFLKGVHVAAAPKAGFAYMPDMVSNLDNTVHFLDQSDTSVVWWTYDYGNGKGSHERNPVYTYPDTGAYLVKQIVINAAGCYDSTELVLDVVPKVRLYIPNVIHPDAVDGRGNDQFKVAGICPSCTGFRMRIWDRWGEQLFESTDPEKGWFGRPEQNGQRAMQGVYIYEIDLTGPRGEPYAFRGTVTVI